MGKPEQGENVQPENLKPENQVTPETGLLAQAAFEAAKESQNGQYSEPIFRHEEQIGKLLHKVYQVSDHRFVAVTHVQELRLMKDIASTEANKAGRAMFDKAGAKSGDIIDFLIVIGSNISAAEVNGATRQGMEKIGDLTGNHWYLVILPDRAMAVATDIAKLAISIKGLFNAENEKGIHVYTVRSREANQAGVNKGQLRGEIAENILKRMTDPYFDQKFLAAMNNMGDVTIEKLQS